MNANGQPRVTLSHVEIDGSRPALGIAEGGLIEWGGNGADTLVEWVKAYEPRGWSVLVMGHGDDLRCQRSVARHNELGPGGRPEYIIADGISLACLNSIVEHNTIVDVTDGGIVIFQAPGSLVANNTIRSIERIMFYGISMVDSGPYVGDFRGTTVTGNVLDAAGALMRHGIDMGPSVGCIPDEEPPEVWSYGAMVTSNELRGEHMGYGFVVSGVEDWVVTGNVDNSVHETALPQDCFGRLADQPGGFQLVPSLVDGTFQPEFEDAVLGFAGNLWPLQNDVSVACAESLIGADVLGRIRSGEAGPLWTAIEGAPNGERIGQCIGLFEPPPTPDSAREVLMVVEPCEPACATVVLMNVSEAHEAVLENVAFFLESFRVECAGLPSFIAPLESARCTITDFLTPGFQVLNWYGFGERGNGWGFDYPFAE